MWKLSRTLTGYYVGVLVVLAILNVIAWLATHRTGMILACSRPAL